MREILFRGKTKETGEWRYGFVAKHKYDFETEEVFVIEDEEGYWAEVIPETIGQFTGLTDKNGFTKIFEGDVVGFTAENELWEPQYYEGTVYFCDGTFWVDCGKDSDDCDVLFTIGHAKLCDESLQIIGNIHDNSELLQ